MCSRPGHEGSVVVRAGWYGRLGQRRQRFKCTTAEGTHRFAEVLPRIVDAASAHVCPDCATTLEAWEGQPAPRLYGFAARDVAAALVMVAGGASYRETAEAIRIRAGRPLSATPGLTPAKGKGKKPRVLPAANRHPQLISDWVEVFAPMIWAAYAPTRWPARIAIDDMGFRHGSRPAAGRGDRAFSVLAAMGYRDDGRAYVAAIQAVPQSTAAAWEALLGSLEGRPAWVVGDGPHPLKAAAAGWPAGGDEPQVQTFRCEWHLARNITQALPTSIERDRDDPIHKLVPAAVRDLTGWQKLFKLISKRAADPTNYDGVINVLLRIRNIVANQAALDITGPRSSGAVEEFFRQLDSTIGDRASRLTNKTRTDALLKLIACQRNGWVDESDWAELIRENLAKTNGRARNQRSHTDSKSKPGLKAYPR